MALIVEHREVSVRKAILLHPENGAVVAFSLWEKLAKILFPLIGRHDFECLFARSLHLNKMRNDGMPSGNTLFGQMSAYTDLQERLSGHGIEETNLAIICLLNTFIDTLVLLIGEGLTEQVLNLAWHEQCPPKARAVEQRTS